MLMHEQLWDDAIYGLCKWIKKLPTPIGIFAVSDARARMLADACLLAGRKVPEEMGIMGVDNNQIDCEFGSPKLTTIECDWWKVGVEVAHLLDELMNGKPAPSRDQLISPSGVIPANLRTLWSSIIPSSPRPWNLPNLIWGSHSE